MDIAILKNNKPFVVAKVDTVPLVGDTFGYVEIFYTVTEVIHLLQLDGTVNVLVKIRENL